MSDWTSGRGYDYVIVGAGAAGCVVASVLASRGTVALIEAGRANISTPARRPADYLRRFGTEDDWSLETVPQPGLGNRTLRYPRGKGLGGSTRINASIWIEPCDDTLLVLQRAGGAEWQVQDVRHSVERIRQLVQPEAPRWLSEAGKRFLAASASLGHSSNAFARMNRRGVRRTAGDVMFDATAAPVAILSDCHVEAVVFDRQRAMGVSARTAKSTEVIRAMKGVILAAGAIHSPAILQRSGIGPRELLARANLPCRSESEGVGEGLEDHLVVPVVFNISAEDRFPGHWSPRDLARWAAVGSGPIASNLAECGLFAGEGHERVQLLATPTDYLRHPARSAAAAMTIGVSQSMPHSRGRVWIESAGATEPPRIDPGYLTDPRDLASLARGMAQACEIADQPPLGEWLRGRRSPPRAMDVDDFPRYIRRMALTLYHPCGTCRMGSDGRSVVDGRLRVRGVESLWIADASVLPGVGSANPNALVMAAAYHGAARID